MFEVERNSAILCESVSRSWVPLSRSVRAPFGKVHVPAAMSLSLLLELGGVRCHGHPCSGRIRCGCCRCIRLRLLLDELLAQLAGGLVLLEVVGLHLGSLRIELVECHVCHALCPP